MRELLIKNNMEETIFFVVEDEKLVEYYKEKNDNKTLDGNIYIGKVQNIISGLDAAFVNLGEGKNAFIHKKDILPKQDNTKNNTENDTPITKLIRPGTPILVEVKKDKMHKKGAKVSTHISLRGRFIVLMPNTPYVTVSSKIVETDVRENLKKFVKETLPENFGAIVRTNAKDVEFQEIKKDIKNQLKKWEEIKNIECDSFPKKVYDSGGMLKKILIDLADYKLDKIIVDNDEIESLSHAILQEIDCNLKIEKSNKDLENLYNIKKEIEKIEANKIWLKSGAFITIDSTEALTAIDVNTGKFIRLFRYRRNSL